MNKIIVDNDDDIRTTPMQQMLSSCSGALLTSLFVTPLDVVKIRLQAQQKELLSGRCYLYCNGLMDHLCPCEPTNAGNGDWVHRPNPGRFTGTIDALVKITRYEGISSLWSGLSPTLVLAIPATMIYFVSYEQLRLKLKDRYNINNNTSVKQQPLWIPLVAGITARTMAATIVSPLELIRTKMQSTKLSYKEVRVALKILIKTDGIRGLWKGITPTLLRDVPFSGIYWMNYETFKSLGPTVPTFMSSFTAGALAGTIAASITVPFDVVKTHKQIEFGEKELYADKPKKAATTLTIFRKIIKQHGYKGLFTGLVPRLIKVAPACAIMIASFEHGKKVFYRYSAYKKNKKNHPLTSETQSKITSDKSQIVCRSKDII